MRRPTLFSLLLTSFSVLAGPVINEFMASNDSTYPDNCDFDDYSDWIELYNPDSSSVALTDYYLTDDLILPLKWKLPDGAAIPAHGYLMARAGGFNAGPGKPLFCGIGDRTIGNRTILLKYSPQRVNGLVIHRLVKTGPAPELPFCERCDFINSLRRAFCSAFFIWA